MKKFFTLLLVAVTMVTTAQESVILRVHHTKGAKYLVKMDMNNDMGSAGFMGMKMEMETKVIDAKENAFETEMSFKRISMDMMQQGMTMSYDSNTKDEDLDDKGKMLKAQIGPMLKMVVTSKTDALGNITDTKVVPNMPGADQFTNQSNNVVYPKEAVKVGSTWTAEKSNQGMTMKFVYTVKSITKESVDVDLSGKISGAGTGDVTGSLKIDREIGIPTFFDMNMDMSANGMKIKSTIKMTTTKM